MLILATIGDAIFTLAPSWPILLTGRVLMGCGLMSPLLWRGDFMEEGARTVS